MKSFDEEIQSTELRESLIRLIKSKYPNLAMEAEDIAQESLIYCWKNKDKFKEECPLIAWVLNKAKWKIIDIHRHNSKEHSKNEKIKEKYYNNNKNNYEEVINYILTKEIINKAINKTLNEDRKIILKKILLEGMSIEQYSKENNLNKITTRTNIHRTRKILKNYIMRHNIPDII